MKRQHPFRSRFTWLNGTTAMTYRLMRTDYLDVNGNGKTLRPSYSILMIESRKGDEARQKMIFDLSPEKGRAIRMMNGIADGAVSTEEIDDVLSDLL